MRLPRYSPKDLAVLEKKFIDISAAILFIATLGYFLYALYGNQLNGSANDFRAFYTAGLMLRSGKAAELYSLTAQYHFQKTFIPTLPNASYLLAFLNPPFVALLMVPFVFVAEPLAYMVWGVCNLILLTSICGIVLVLFKNVRWQVRYLTIAMILLFIPVWESMLEGQFSLLLVLAFLLGWVYLRNDKQVAAGYVLSMLFFKPQLIVLPAGILIWKYPKAFLAMLIGGCFFLSLSLAAGGFSLLRSYVPFLLGITKWHDLYGIHPQQQNSWSGIIYAFIPPQWRLLFIILWITGDFFALGSLFISWKGKKTDNLFNVQYALLVLVTLFTCPHVNFHDLSILVVPGIIIGVSAVSKRTHNAYEHVLQLAPFIGYIVLLIDYLFLWFHKYIHISVLFILSVTILLTVVIYQRKHPLYHAVS